MKELKQIKGLENCLVYKYLVSVSYNNYYFYNYDSVCVEFQEFIDK